MHKNLLFLILSTFFCSIVLSSCNLVPINASPQKAEVLFEVVIPSSLPENTRMQVEVLDDVTGLAFNPSRIDMVQKDARTFYAKSSSTLHSIVKYRYLKVDQTTSTELDSKGQQVRFRVLIVDAPVVVNDIVAGWQDEPYKDAVGTVEGQLVEKANNTPLPNQLVTIQGIQAITASDGSFTLTGVTPGLHNLTVIALDGAYQPLQQGAVVSENAVTPVNVGLEKRKTVNVTFEVRLPEGETPISDLKMATSLYPLGNLYADVYSGNSMVSADLPTMQKTSSGVYRLQLSLPVGAYFTYKYTLGDGFWNGELTKEGSFKLREIVIPEKDTVQRDLIDSFRLPNSAPVTFNVHVPDGLPAEEAVSIQFNPFGWMAPMPMVKTGERTWSFILYNPQNYFSQISFRYCRNTVCDLTREEDTGNSAEDRHFTPAVIAQNIQSSVTAWHMYQPAQTATTVTTAAEGMQPRTDFLIGYEIDTYSGGLLRSAENSLFASISSTGANWVILDPSWTAQVDRTVPIAPIPGSDFLWPDLLQIVQNARTNGLSVALFPQLRFTADSQEYQALIAGESGSIQKWMDAYRHFILQNADAANIAGASALILGDPGVVTSKTLPNQTQVQGEMPAMVSDNQWQQLIQEVRSRYSGAIIAAVSLVPGQTSLPAWVSDVDAVYLLIRPEMSAEEAMSFATVYKAIDTYLEEEVKPMVTDAGKTALVGLSVPSVTTAYQGCSAEGVDCSLNRSSIGLDTNLDLDMQAQFTNAVILSASSKTWLGGFFSRQYQEAGSLQDTSDSVRGKPANDVLWYWYHFLSGKAQ